MNKIVASLLSLIYCFTIYSQSWTQLTDFPGTQRDDGIAFTITNKAYCLSGLEVGWQCTGNGFAFDASTETWTAIASLPVGKERQYATGFSNNGYGYMLGGLNCSGVCLKDLWQYSVSTNAWTALSDFPGQGRQGMSNFIIKNKLYIVGGRLNDNSTTNEVWQFDFFTSIWTQKNNLPFAGIWRGAAFTIDTLGYVCYGINNTTIGTFNHFIYQYNYMTDIWTVVPNILLPARNYIACAVTNKKACLYGGQDSLNVITNDIKLFNPADTSLTTFVGVPTIGRKGTMAFALNDVFYITTGLDVTQNRIKETWKNVGFVGLKENGSLLNIQMFPNPANDKLFIQLNYKSTVNIKLYNQLGELVFDTNSNYQNVEINTSSFFNGMYILIIKTQEGMSSKKLLITH